MDYSKIVQWDDKTVCLEFEWEYDRSGDPVVVFAGFFDKETNQLNDPRDEATIMAESILEEEMKTMFEEDPWWPSVDGKEYG